VTRVLIGANSKNVRLDLASLLAAESRFKIVGKLSIESALDQLENLDPDVVILHLESSADESRLFGLDPAEIPLRPAFVILTDNAENFPLDALRSADAVLPLGAKAEEIIATIDASSAGLVVFHRDVFNSLLLPLVGSEQPIDPSDRILTPRETGGLAHDRRWAREQRDRLAARNFRPYCQISHQRNSGQTWRLKSCRGRNPRHP
jgi:DNA-binding NarL/FixJ family response regulator